MNDQLQHFIAGRTKIIERKDKQGNPVLEICTSELTPFGAKTADTLAGFTILGVFSLSIITLIQSQNPDIEMAIFLFLATIASYPLATSIWRAMLRSRTTIKMTLDNIEFNGEKGSMRLSRMQKHNFTLRKHDKALQEKRAHELETKQAQKNNQIVVKKPYYGEAFHVVLSHMGQRHDLVEVYKHKNAHDVMAALTLCDNHLNNHLNIGSEGKRHKDDDWKDSPGGL